MKCRICQNYLNGLDTCKFCHFEFDEEYWACDDDKWDILNLNDDYEWSHLQIMDRLKYKGIECLSADIWFDDNLAYLIGAKANDKTVANALGVHEDVVYNDFEHGLIIINLYQEKALRNKLFDPTTYNRTRWLNEIRNHLENYRNDNDLMQLCISYTLQSVRNDPKALNRFKWSSDC